LLYQACTLQGSAIVFTANQQQMTVRSYGNCSNFWPYSVLPTYQNKKLNTTENNQSSVLHCLGKGAFTPCIIFQASFEKCLMVWFACYLMILNEVLFGIPVC
jgi:hypothetical protein